MESDILLHSRAHLYVLYPVYLRSSDFRFNRNFESSKACSLAIRGEGISVAA